jgi:hypothetical protein
MRILVAAGFDSNWEEAHAKANRTDTLGFLSGCGELSGCLLLMHDMRRITIVFLNLQP